MYVVEHGSGTPILIIHGFCVDHHLMFALDSTLAASGKWKRVYIDLPGMGQSVAGPEIDSADAVAEAVVAFAREKFGNERFAVIGNSFGGMIARHVVAEFGTQVLGVALLCPAVVGDRNARTLPPKTVLQGDQSLLESLDAEDRADYEEMAVVQSRENWNAFRDFVLPGLRAFDSTAIERISGSYALSVEPEERMPEFEGPALFIMGRQDHVVGFQDQLGLAEHYLQSSVTVLDRAGHNAHLDQPRITSVLFEEWLLRMEIWMQEDRM